MYRNYSLRALLSAMMLVLALAGINRALAQAAGPNGPAAITGTLEIVIRDDFDRGRHERSYFVRDDRDDGLYELQFDRTPPGHLRTGHRVTVRGRAVGRTMRVDALDTSGTAPATSADAEAAAAAERRAVVLIVDLIDAKASTRYSTDQIAANMFTGTRSVDGLFRDSSHGRLGFAPDTDGNGAPDVFGPFAIAESRTTGDYYAWAYAAEAAAEAAGIDLTRYQHRVFVLPRYSDLGTAWAGIANVGCGTFCRSWIAEGESPMVFAHELGHNLGMAHAGTDPENDGVTNSAYGDYSDPMGLSRAWHRFNGAHLDQMGWLDAFSGAVSTVVSGGTYRIAAIGTDPATVGAPQVIKIEKPDSSDFYYLTYRQPTGYDDSLSTSYTQGVNVHRYRGGYSVTNFITGLSDGARFEDPANDVIVTQLGHDGTTATVEIAYDVACSTAAPSVAVSPSLKLVRPGAVVDLSVAVTNRDGTGCGQTGFALSQAGGLGGALGTAAMTLAAGGSGTTTLRIDTAGLADGSFDGAVAAIDTDGFEPHHATAGSGTYSVVIDGTAPSAPGGLTGAAIRKNRVALSWEAAFDAVSGVASYTVYRDGVAIGTTATTGFTDGGLTSGAAYSYAVVATDGVGNASPASAPLSVTTGGAKGNAGLAKGRKK